MGGSQTTAIIAQEAARMGDLAQAIVSLAHAAEKRRGARADLIEATDTVAKAIRKELRSGDKVVVPIAPPKVLVQGAKPETVTYRAVRVRSLAALISKTGGWNDALLRDDTILGLSDAEGKYEADGFGSPYYAATPEERERFVHEAENVVKAFRELLDSQAEEYDETAQKATKLTPR